jgi:hypothetical protein
MTLKNNVQTRIISILWLPAKSKNLSIAIKFFTFYSNENEGMFFSGVCLSNVYIFL